MITALLVSYGAKSNSHLAVRSQHIAGIYQVSASNSRFVIRRQLVRSGFV